MKILTDCFPGAFHSVGQKFFLPTKLVSSGSDVVEGQKLPLTCMFEINFAMVGGERVGFLFQSRFETENGGAWLRTFLRNKGQATDTETLIKDEHLVLYNFPNKGTLAISPLVNSEIATIFEEQ